MTFEYSSKYLKQELAHLAAEVLLPSARARIRLELGGLQAQYFAPSAQRSSCRERVKQLLDARAETVVLQPPKAR